MKKIFFEVEDWERERLQYTFQDALLISDRLTLENVSTSTFAGVEIISPFIASHVTRDVIDKMPSLKAVVTRSTGYDHIDVEYCRSKGIIITNVPEYGSNTVAEHTFALLLSLTRKIYQSVNQSKNLNFDHHQIRGVDVYGKTLGVVGLGKIGMNVLRIAQGFGMKIAVYARHRDEELKNKMGFEYRELDELLRTSDVISMHLPLTPQTHHIINRENIMKFKRGSYLLNTARGGLIDTEAIIMGLTEGVLEGVGLDVLEDEADLSEEAAILTSNYKNKVNMETLILDHILINHPKVLITPHNAFNSVEALQRIVDTSIDNVRAIEEGHPKNTV